jgi:tRNA pseudouridine38-40 synthase
MKYFAKIRFVGTDFSGFQVQPDKRTVQGELNRATESLFGCPCKITGCSRTDSGVHANEFCITIEPQKDDFNKIPADKIPKAIAIYLPPDLSLYYAEAVDDKFHPRYDVKSKEYKYVVYNAEVNNPFHQKRAWQVYRKITDDGVEKIRQACKKFIGTHDFTAFMNTDSDIEDRTRTIYDFTVTKNGDELVFLVSADGFLYNMVRIMVGTLIFVAFDNFTADDIEKMLESKERTNAGMTAPADGLYLNKVTY